MSKVKNLKISLQTGTTDTLFASWDFSKSYLDHYKVTWYYATGDGVWFSGGSSDVTAKNAIYTKPTNATKVKVTVKPVSKTYQSNKKDVSYWTGISVSTTYITSSSPPEKVSTPEVNINKYKLTATLKDIQDKKADQIEFYIVKGNSKFQTGIVSVKTQRAIFSCSVTAGGKYRVRCRAINLVGKTKVYGQWSSYSDEYTTIPLSVSNVKSSALSETSIQVKWDKSATATSYVVEYTTDKSYFNSNPSGVSSATVYTNLAKITGLTSGEKWFFRVKAVNGQGESGWSSIISQIIGLKPAAPTTWSSTTTAIIGEEVKLYWVHNTEDGSKQTGAQIELTINNVTKTIDFTDNSDEDEDYKIYSHTLDLSEYTEGADILWRVRTKGITNKYSDWSMQRDISLYAPPTVSLHLGRDIEKWLWDTFNFETDSIDTAPSEEIVESLPYNITAKVGPNSQKPIGYHVSITAEETYETDDVNGETILVNAGEEIYSKVSNVSDNPFTLELSAGNISLKNNQSYKLTVVVSMDSGLTAEASEIFTVNWSDANYEPDASIAIDRDTLCAYILPFCKDDDDNLIEDVILSVYRREYDGKFTELATELYNDGVTTITDPHPALDYARYRIVARDKATGTVSYEDLPGIPIDEPGIVIQWDEKWIDFDYHEEDEPETPPWSGSMVRLLYNVDISESSDPDVALVEYIGREHPVTFYGTQKGENGNWSCEVPHTDKETISALRRLRAWSGDVYVRESSGTGYWAHITVSISTTHCELGIPVTFSVKRVEGGER